MTQPAVAYSYVRFSTPDQAKGDSLRRQTEAAEEWCKRNDITLDTSTTLHDLGKSAFTGRHRENPDRNALACFLKLVERGRIPKGSFLIVEALDRLTREHLRAAVTLFLNLLESGISIVTTKPERVFKHDSDDMVDIIIAVVELCRGHGESKLKSERCQAAWGQRKKRARENGEVYTRRLPGWVEVRGGKLVAIPEHAATIERIFSLTAAGYGRQRIVRLFTQEKVKTFGRSGKWSYIYLSSILKDRRVLGEFQPRLKNGQPDGDVITGYYPAIVTEADWEVARMRVNGRKQEQGRTTKYIDLFAGLLKSGLDGDKYRTCTRNGNRVYLNAEAIAGRGTMLSFPSETFERAILTCLKEQDPHEILNGDSKPDETAVLAGELERVQASIAMLGEEMEAHGESALLFKRLREKEGREKELQEALQVAREKARHPVSESWGECQSLIDLLDSSPDPDDGRLRLRSSLRRIIDSITLVIVKRGIMRLCRAQVWFTTGSGIVKDRSYFIIHKPPHRCGERTEPGAWYVLSRSPTTKLPYLQGDLRKPTEAEAVKSRLQEYPMQAIEGLLKNGQPIQ
jgi:DNA invertase Pin-like site-specific DNA recombinase